MLLHVMNSLNTSFPILSFQNYSDRALNTVNTESNFIEIIKQLGLQFKDFFGKNISLLNDQHVSVEALKEKIIFKSSVLLTLAMAGLVTMIFSQEGVIEYPSHLEIDRGHSNRNPINRRNLQPMMPYEVKGRFPRLTYENYRRAINKRIQIDNYENYDDLMNMINNPVEAPADIYRKFPCLNYKDYLETRNTLNDDQIRVFDHHHKLIRKIKIPAEVLKAHPEIELPNYRYLSESLTDEEISAMNSSAIIDYIDMQRFKINKEEFDFLKRSKVDIESFHEKNTLRSYLAKHFSTPA